jgi:protein-tyrosine phosphatase
MPPVVIDVRNAEDARDVIHRAVQALAEGRLVAFPTETVYGIGASACRPEAVERLMIVKSRTADAPFTLARRSTSCRTWCRWPAGSRDAAGRGP